MVSRSGVILQSFLLMFFMSSKRRNPAYEIKHTNRIRRSASVAEVCPCLVCSFARISGVMGSFRTIGVEFSLLKPCRAILAILLSVGEGRPAKLCAHLIDAAASSAEDLDPVVDRWDMYNAK